MEPQLIEVKKDILTLLEKLGIDVDEYKNRLALKYKNRELRLIDWLKERTDLQSRYEFELWLDIKKKKYGQYTNLSFEQNI